MRVTWDLPADPALALALWSRLQVARVLFLDVLVSREAAPALAPLGRSLREQAGPRVTLTGTAEALGCGGEALGAEALHRADVQLLPEYPAPTTVVDLASRSAGLVPALWCTPEGLRFLPSALRLAAEAGLRALALLNPPAPAPALTAADRAAAVQALRASGLAGKLELRVHDLFLAEALGLDPFRGYAGCQAGGYLAHVTADGRLVACRTLPTPLGDLATFPLAGLWQGAARRVLRAGLAQTPPGCEACGLATSCGGGCRGYAASLGRDPSCPRGAGAVP